MKYTGAPLSFLNLDEGLHQREPGKKAPIGFTYKTMGAGFWALRKLEEGAGFWEVLGPILNAGGDVDTNAAVAGAVFGAAQGFDAIPQNLRWGVHNRERLDEILKALT